MTVSPYLALFLARRDQLTGEDRAALDAIPVSRESFAAGETIISAGPTPRRSALLIVGMAMRVHATGQGERVVSALHVPGDFVDLHALLLETLDHDIIAAGPCKVEFVPHGPLLHVTRRNPHLTRMLWLSTLIDAKCHRTWIVAGAALSAHQRIGHLMCELHARLSIVNLTDGEAFDLPLDQRAMAEVLGYSVAHVNRAVQDLRRRGLLIWEGRRVRLPDPNALAALCEFDPGYLEIAQTSR